jgi:hypothetical protein
MSPKYLQNVTSCRAINVDGKSHSLLQLRQLAFPYYGERGQAAFYAL